MRRPFWIPLAGSLRIAGMLTWMVAPVACTEGSPDSPSDAVSTRGTGEKSDVGGGGNAGASAGNSGNAGASAGNSGNAGASAGNSGNAGNAGASVGAAGNAESAGAGAGGEAATMKGGADGTGGTSAMRPNDAGATDAGLPRFILGADVSSLLERERAGAQFYDKGTRGELLSIMKSRGFNYVRIRTWVDPTAAGGYAAGKVDAWCDLAHTITLAQRVKQAGMGFLLNPHFSDTWADPGHQAKPAAWATLPFAQLRTALASYTTEVVSQLKTAGVTPQMVQIGNEITAACCGKKGKATHRRISRTLRPCSKTRSRRSRPWIPRSRSCCTSTAVTTSSTRIGG